MELQIFNYEQKPIRTTEIHGELWWVADEEGFPVTRIDANVYPVGSELSAKYEHPEGIELTLEDVEKLNIEIC